MGLLPSITTVTALAAPLFTATRPSRNTAPGSGTAARPSCGVWCVVCGVVCGVYVVCGEGGV